MGKNAVRICAAAAAMAAIVLFSGHILAQDALRTPRTAEPPHAPATAKRATARQKEAALRIAARASAVVDGLAADAKAGGMDAGWRQALLERLLSSPPAVLDRVERQAFTLQDVATAMSPQVIDDADVIGDPSRDLTFKSIAPCRYIDTRNAAGKIAGVRAYNADLSGAAYGGSGACNLLTAFQVSTAGQIGALVLNITVVDTSTAGVPGFLAAKPAATSPTTSLINWYVPGTSVQVANQGVVALDQVSGTEFVIETSGPVHAIVDVFGAYVEPSATPFQRPAIFSSQVLVASGATGTLTVSCPSGYAMTSGSCNAFGSDHRLSTSAPSSATTWMCTSRNHGATSENLYGSPVCARVPGR